MLFSGTLRSNLDPFSTADDSKLWRALERVCDDLTLRALELFANAFYYVSQVHLGDSIRALKEGLDTFVAENGENFSVGQRQVSPSLLTTQQSSN